MELATRIVGKALDQRPVMKVVRSKEEGEEIVTHLERTFIPLSDFCDERHWCSSRDRGVCPEEVLAKRGIDEYRPR